MNCGFISKIVGHLGELRKREMEFNLHGSVWLGPQQIGWRRVLSGDVDREIILGTVELISWGVSELAFSTVKALAA